jgi:hypothetical protein
MAITDKEQGVWGLDQVYNKINEGGIWNYSGVSAFFVWGQNPGGGLGQNNTTQYSSPIQIPGTTWSGMIEGGGAGSSKLMATKTDGTLWTWGSNSGGQLGLNTPNPSNVSSPVQLPGTTWGTEMGAGNMNTGAIKTDGTLWTWGANADGILGHNNANPTRYSSPTQVPGTTWSKIIFGTKSMGAIKTDGTLWMWGAGDEGVLGINNTTHYSSPKQVPGTTWSSLGGGREFSTAIKTDGTLWSWGYNGHGMLGQNNKTKYSSPIQIPGTTWSTVSGSYWNMLSVRTDGTLWTWGSNSYGTLGQNAPGPSQYSSPIQIPGTTWSRGWGYFKSNIALKTDGTLWSWGYNNVGQLGLNDKTHYSSPTQVAGLWTSTMGGGKYERALLATL